MMWELKCISCFSQGSPPPATEVGWQGAHQGEVVVREVLHPLFVVHVKRRHVRWTHPIS